MKIIFCIIFKQLIETGKPIFLESVIKILTEKCKISNRSRMRNKLKNEGSEITEQEIRLAQFILILGALLIII